MSGLGRRLLQLTKVLAIGGDTHTLQDILDAIEQGKMQSFTVGESWAITQILEFPRKKVLEIFLVMGEIDELEILHAQILKFAKETECDLIRAFGREGWHDVATKLGWPRPRMRLYLREV